MKRRQLPRKHRRMSVHLAVGGNVVAPPLLSLLLVQAGAPSYSIVGIVCRLDTYTVHMTSARTQRTIEEAPCYAGRMKEGVEVCLW